MRVCYMQKVCWRDIVKQKGVQIMDLHDVLGTVELAYGEAKRAFHAGHHDDSEKLLMEVMLALGKYFDERTTPAGDVTESATSEKPAEEKTETPAEAPGAVLPASQFDPAASAQQKALDQAGP